METRRPILIDLIFEPEEQIQEHYSGIRRENEVLIAETDLPRPLGKQLTLMGKASPLYDRQGKITGAIESIRDITARKQEEDELRAAYEADFRHGRGTARPVRQTDARMNRSSGTVRKNTGPLSRTARMSFTSTGATTSCS